MKSFLKKIVVWVLMLEARLTLARHRPHIVAITGTVGKTSTKDAIFCALSPFFSVRKSEKSYNSDFGIPLTILRLKNAAGNPFLWIKNLFLGVLRIFFGKREPQWLVLEVGAGEPGDIKKFAQMLSPDIAVITRFAEVPVHVEFFTSPEAVTAEKTELARAVRKSGVLVLGGDDPKVAQMKNAFPDLKRILYGTGAAAEVRGSDYAVAYQGTGTGGFPLGLRFTVTVGGRSFPVLLKGVLGAHLTQSVLAAFAVARALNLDVGKVAEALTRLVLAPGRMRLIEGRSDSLVIDDSYNASPVAMKEALSTLGSLAVRGRKMAVLGTMAELGAFSAKEHLKIGALAARSSSELVVVGESAREIATGARQAGMPAAKILFYKDNREAAVALPRTIQAGDVVLVKGSQSARMERVVQSLMREPECAKELLVRQDDEWI